MQLSHSSSWILGMLVAVAAAAGEQAEPSTPASEYLLRYKFQANEVIRWKVTHLVTTETSISGNTQTAKSRSVSTKAWRVTQVSPEGHITFTHTVEDVDMWRQISDRPEVSYNSATDAQAPPEYQQVAKTIGQPLTTATISDTGEIVEKEGNASRGNLGLGDITMLLPPKPVREGSHWYEPSELQIRHQDGKLERIKIRKLYTLEKVQTGVATIRVKTEVLTPVDDPRIQVQLVQQLTNGDVKFDIDAGRVLAKQMDWDETVIGFEKPDSLMKYLARFSEELLATDATAARSVPAGPRR
jgi:hypothetical protein